MDVTVITLDQEVSVERDFEQLYRSTFPAVAKLVRRWNGSLQDTKDIFHDGLVLLFEKEQDGSVTYATTREAYLVGICKHLWIKKFSRDVSKISLNEFEATISVPDDYYPTINMQALLKIVTATGKRCLDLLQSIYFRRASMVKTADELGYRNEHSASVQKYKCLEKIREQVKNKSISYEDFFE
jgi:DNA-directed RNA polymerase specialized sigma24 family protein